ncbi:hypothetical protein CK247_31730, partial [Klebsiella pneumoniae]
SPARRKLAIYKPRLSPVQQGNPLLGLDVDVRTAISPARRKLAIYKPRLSPVQQGNPLLGLDVDVRT